MIAIDRGDEPKELAEFREMRIARTITRDTATRIKAGHFANDSEVAKIVRQTLIEAQHYQCAYCGVAIRLECDPIDHFRPKDGAENVDWSNLQDDEPPLSKEKIPKQFVAKTPAVDLVPYWWLAWTWENFFLACSACNSQSNKGNWFPLRRGETRLAELSLPTTQETPLLLDPTELDPLDHITFEPSNYPPGHWRAKGLTLRGRWTVVLLCLNESTTHQRSRQEHVKNLRRDKDFAAAVIALHAGDKDGLEKNWKRATEALLEDERPFRALTYAVLDQEIRIPAEQQLNLRLNLKKPGRLNPRSPAPLFRDRPELSGFDEDLRIRIRALGERAESTEKLRHVLVDICRAGGRTAEQLGQLLGRSADSLTSNHLAALCLENPPRLQFDTATSIFRCPP